MECWPSATCVLDSSVFPTCTVSFSCSMAHYNDHHLISKVKVSQVANSAPYQIFRLSRRPQMSRPASCIQCLRNSDYYFISVAELFDAYSSVTVPEVTDIKDLICKPKRNSRPAHICLIVRGPPGAGKTYCSKLIRVICQSSLVTYILSSTVAVIEFYRTSLHYRFLQ